MSEEKKDPRDLWAAKLELPPSFAMRRAVFRLYLQNSEDPEYACAAALGLCVKGLGRFRRQLAGWNGAKPGEFAAAVINEIDSRGLDVGQVLYGRSEEEVGPGIRALNLIIESITPDAAVNEALGNSERPAGQAET